jgi:hypothetical protein
MCIKTPRREKEHELYASHSSNYLNGTVNFICAELGRFHGRVSGSGHVLRADGNCVPILLAWNSTVRKGT